MTNCPNFPPCGKQHSGPCSGPAVIQAKSVAFIEPEEQQKPSYKDLLVYIKKLERDLSTLNNRRAYAAQWQRDRRKRLNKEAKANAR